MSESPNDGLRERLTKSGEEALGKLAQDLLENPLVNGAIARAFDAREKAAQAQEVAMGALNLPSASDLERLTRRVRSLSQRLEGIEDGVDRVDERLASLAGASRLDERLAAIEERLEGMERRLGAIKPDGPRAAATKADKRLTGIEKRLEQIAEELGAVRRTLPDAGTEAPPREQERLRVDGA
jgi:chromosome segregation ATPase